MLDVLAVNGHEKLIFGRDEKVGLKVVLAIHSTVLGPSTGGTRMIMLPEERAIDEALRLSYAMTFKNAIIDEPFGGSKAVLIGDPTKPKSYEFLHALGEFIESLKGTFLTGIDMGLSFDDAKIIGERTQYIFNSKGRSGDTTAHGVYKGMQEAVHYKLGRSDMHEVKVAVQGAGIVGGTLIDLLLENGAEVYISDIDSAQTARYRGQERVHIVDNEMIYDIECDVFAPCAVGEVINDDTIDRLRCSIIAGGANNQLKDEVRHARMLHERGILHAPDFVVNAGGVCHGMCEVKGEDVSCALEKTDLIPGILREVLRRSKETNTPPLFVAYELAYEKIKAKESPYSA